MMLKRSPFRSKAPPPRAVKQWEGEIKPRSPALRIADTRARLVVPLPKEGVLQHEGYMNLVRAMACAHCGRPPRSEFCHSDAGKGTALRTDCRRGWPGCSNDLRTGREGCHTIIGSRGLFTKEQRRALEDRYAAQTRAAIVAAGTWPARLPRWTE